MRISDCSSDVCTSYLLLRIVFSRNVVANQPVLEDFVDVDLCPQRRSVFGTPGDHGWRWEVGDTQKAGSEQRSEEHTSELQSLMRISYAVFCLKKKKKDKPRTKQHNQI